MPITKASGQAVAPAAKGDLVVGSATNDAAVLAVGSANQVLTVDSSTTTGLKWAAASAGGANWSLLNAGGTSLTGSSTTVSGISNADKIMIRVINAQTNFSGDKLRVRLNGDTASNYLLTGGYYTARSTVALTLGSVGGSDNGIYLCEFMVNTGSVGAGGVVLSGCNASGLKQFSYVGGASTSSSATDGVGYWAQGMYNSSSVISSISVGTQFGSFTAGTVFVYTSA